MTDVKKLIPQIDNEINVRRSDTIKNELKSLHDTDRLSWRQIALIPRFQPIPPGTLCAIAKGYPIPKKWHRYFGIRVTRKRYRLDLTKYVDNDEDWERLQEQVRKLLE